MPDGQTIKVMAVDDDDLILDIYEQGLTAKGYSVRTFLSSVQAREYLFQTQDIPDVILMDIMMPNMDGISLMHEIHSATKTSNVPIIAVSGLSDAATLNDAFLFGAIDYVVKPFDINVLDMKIRRAIETIKKRTSQ